MVRAEDINWILSYPMDDQYMHEVDYETENGPSFMFHYGHIEDLWEILK